MTVQRVSSWLPRPGSYPQAGNFIEIRSPEFLSVKTGLDEDDGTCRRTRIQFVDVAAVQLLSVPPSTLQPRSRLLGVSCHSPTTSILNTAAHVSSRYSDRLGREPEIASEFCISFRSLVLFRPPFLPTFLSYQYLPLRMKQIITSAKPRLVEIASEYLHLWFCPLLLCIQFSSKSTFHLRIPASVPSNFPALNYLLDE